MLLAVCGSGRGVFAKYTGKCAGGGLALTPDLYKLGRGAYESAACIPDGAFCYHPWAPYGQCEGSPGETFTGSIVLENMLQLVYIGGKAFYGFRGKLTMRGSFPKLEYIADEVFRSGKNSDSAITLNGAPSLRSVGSIAFAHFPGVITITGEFPMWNYIGGEAFSHSDGPSTSVIEVKCRGSGWSVGHRAFVNFVGNRNEAGEACYCYDCSEECTGYALPDCTTTTMTTVRLAAPSWDGPRKNGSRHIPTTTNLNLNLIIVVACCVSS